MTTPTPRRLGPAGFVVIAMLTAASARAENIELPDSVGPGTFIFASEPICGTLDLADNEVTSSSGLRTYRISGTNIDITGSMRARASVDPVAGETIRTAHAVSVESGLFWFSGSSPALGIVGETLIHGKVIGVYHLIENQPEFLFNWLIDVDYAHPNLVAVVGPINSVEHLVYDLPWSGPPTDVPWETEFSSPFCYTNSPEIRVFSDPAPEPNPVTYELTGTTYVAPTSACPFIEFGTQVPISVQFTFDSNARDLNTMDPDIGEYVSCDDTYGSRSGARISVAGFTWQTACVGISIQNDSADGSPGTVEADIYTVELIGDGDSSGTLIRLEDDSAQAFDDDALPATPPILSSPPSPPGTFVLLDGPNTFVTLNGVCEIATDAMTLTQVGDADFDGVPDTRDNCTQRANLRQRDSDGDGFGNACDPDLNGDNVVNALDLGLFKAVFYSSGNLDADFDSDGTVNAVDLGVMRSLFFAPPGPSGVAQ